MLWSELSLIQGMVEQPWGNRCDDSQNWGRSEFLWQHYRRGWASSASHHLDGSCRRRVAWHGSDHCQSHGGDSERFACGPCAKPIFCTHLFYAWGCSHAKIWACTRTQTSLFLWSNVRLCGWRWVGQVECSATKPVINSARPMPPAVPRAPQASPPAIPVAGSGLAPFRHFFFARCGARASRGQNKGFPRSGRMQGSMGPERCGSGPPNGPFEWPHSRFGRGRYLNSDPPAGCGVKTAVQGCFGGLVRACPRGPANAQGGLGRV